MFVFISLGKIEFAMSMNAFSSKTSRISISQKKKKKEVESVDNFIEPSVKISHTLILTTVFKFQKQMWIQWYRPN